MSAYQVTYRNVINQRQAVIVVLGYSAKTVGLEFNTFGGNLTIIAIQPK